MGKHEIASFTREFREQLEIWGASALDRTNWAERFRGFGFHMDCGNSYQEHYGLSIDDVEGLRRNPDRVDDIQILGNAVFSQCRYITHWSMGSCRRELEWLQIALKRLEELTEEEAFPPALRWSDETLAAMDDAATGRNLSRPYRTVAEAIVALDEE